MLRPQREITVDRSGGVVHGVAYTGTVPHLIEDRVYEPISRLSLSAAARMRRLQSGSLGTYVGYLIALVVLVLAAARLGIIG